VCDCIIFQTIYVYKKRNTAKEYTLYTRGHPEELTAWRNVMTAFALETGFDMTKLDLNAYLRNRFESRTYGLFISDLLSHVVIDILHLSNGKQIYCFGGVRTFNRWPFVCATTQYEQIASPFRVALEGVAEEQESVTYAELSGGRAISPPADGGCSSAAVGEQRTDAKPLVTGHVAHEQRSQSDASQNAPAQREQRNDPKPPAGRQEKDSQVSASQSVPALQQDNDSNSFDPLLSQISTLHDYYQCNVHFGLDPTCWDCYNANSFAQAEFALETPLPPPSSPV